MQSKMYKSFKPIKKLLDNNHLLQANVYIDHGDNNDSYVPLSSLVVTPVTKTRFSADFQTLDPSEGVTNMNYYWDLKHYLSILMANNDGDYNTYKIHENTADRDLIKHLDGKIICPNYMLKQSFTFKRHHFIVMTIHNNGSLSIRALLSPDLNKQWTLKLGSGTGKVYKRSIKNILYLLHLHLFSYPMSLEQFSKNDYTLMNCDGLSTSRNKNIVVFNVESGKVKLNLDHYNHIQFVDVTNSWPYLVFKANKSDYYKLSFYTIKRKFN